MRLLTHGLVTKELSFSSSSEFSSSAAFLFAEKEPKTISRALYKEIRVPEGVRVPKETREAATASAVTPRIANPDKKKDKS